MVEYDDVPTATAAKSQLHGCDIYSGSCTLKVEFAKTDRLNVKRNDDNTWDYTEEFKSRHPEAFREPKADQAPMADVRGRPWATEGSIPRGLTRTGRTEAAAATGE